MTPKFGLEHYPAGSIIFRQGDLPDRFFLITHGEVEVLHRRPTGEESVINRLHTGEFFGEIGLLTNSRRVATIRALTPVDVMAMDRETFGNWLNTSMLSRDEINLVMVERMSNVEGLQPVEGDGKAGAKIESAGTTPLSTTDTEPEETVRSVKESSTSSPAPAPVNSGPQDFKPGDMIIRQGDLADRFYIIIEGEVEVFQEEEGRKNHIAHLNSGN
jgi:CRP-like cAMP-binding protein